MDKNTILSLLKFITAISVISSIFCNNAAVSGNTFTMPENSNTGNNYHSYNIDNKDENNMNRYNIDNSNNKSHNSHNSNSNNNNNDNKSQNIYANDKAGDSINQNNYSPDIDSSGNVNEAPKTAAPAIKPKATVKPKSKNKSKSRKITKIEFSKHFIRLPAGKTARISFKTTPDKSLSGFIYKSLDESVVTFNNKKITGIKKGFATILIMLSDGTVKAACPVKIM